MTDGQRQYQIDLHTIALAYLRGYRAAANRTHPRSEFEGHALTGWDDGHAMWHGDHAEPGEVEIFAQDAADEYAGDWLHDNAQPSNRPDTPSLDVAGWWFQGGF